MLLLTAIYLFFISFKYIILKKNIFSWIAGRIGGGIIFSILWAKQTDKTNKFLFFLDFGKKKMIKTKGNFG